MRCLGIPARCTTNFNSAHDTDENLQVDVYLNEYGEKLNSMSFDSVWYCFLPTTPPCSAMVPSPSNSFENFPTASGLLPRREGGSLRFHGVTRKSP